MATKTFPPVKEQMEIILRGVEDLISAEELEERLEKSRREGRPLRVKLGTDPSRPDLHIGHAVVLRKLRQFQELGHQAVLIIGDFTAAIGDPTGRNKTRPPISLEKAREYGRTYLEQATLVLKKENLEIVHNSAWLEKMNLADVIRLAAQVTVAQILERDDFSKRYRTGVPIFLHEFLYPLAQAQDSVELKADIELGGTDQLFNLLVGRELQRRAGQDPQIVLTMPLLVGTDGVEKMSKSAGNYIGLTDPPEEMYGKTMSIPDELIIPYFTLATEVPESEILQMKTAMEQGANPRDFKRRLARELVTLYHGSEQAQQAEAAFDRLFVQKETPDEMPTWSPPAGQTSLGIIDILTQSDLLPSRGEARRMIRQRAVRVDNERVLDEHFQLELKQEHVIQVGKRKFLRIKCSDD